MGIVKNSSKMEDVSVEKLQKLTEGKKQVGELSDDELDSVSGGAVLGSDVFFMSVCPVCGFKSTLFDDPDNDQAQIQRQHQQFKPDCIGRLDTYWGDTSIFSF